MNGELEQGTLRVNGEQHSGSAGICNALYLFIYLFILIYFIIYFIFGCIGSSLLHAVFSLVVESRCYSSLRCARFSLRRLLLWSMGSRRVGFSSCGTRVQ